MSRSLITRAVQQHMRRPVGAAVSLLAFTVAAQAQTDPPTPSGAEERLEEVVVTSQIIFTQNDAFGATKMGLALKDTPQSVTVVTGDMIDFAGLQNFNDFYKLDASGGTSNANDGFPRNYYRGFSQVGQNAIRVDGFRLPGFINLDFAIFDRFEVMKGPTSTLYGQSSIGGTLNAVSKLPQDRSAAELGIELDDLGSYRVDADLTGPIGGGDRWHYRLIAAYDDANSFVDFAFDRLKMVSSSVEFRPDDSTKLLLRFTHQESTLRFHFPAILQTTPDGTGLQIPEVPRSRFTGMPWNGERQQATFLQTQAEHVFASGWTLRAHAQRVSSDLVLNGFAPVGPIDEAGFAYYASAYHNDDGNSLYGGEVNLFGDVEVLGREHTLFAGVDYTQIRGDNHFGREVPFAGYENSLFNLFNPDYGAIPVHRTVDDYTYFYDTDSEHEQYGATVQLIVRPTERLSLLLGARHSTDRLSSQVRSGPTEQFDDFTAAPFGPWDRNEYRATVYQAGATYELSPAINVYASYGETFEPTTGRVFVDESTPNGRPVDPERGTNYEIGLKGELSKDLSFSVAVFDMTRTNIVQADRQHPGFDIPLGEQQGRGVELGAQGRLLPQVNLFASLAYLDAEYSDGEFAGLQPPNAPKFGASVFGTYELLAGRWQGLGFGLGVVHKDGIEGFDAGTLESFDFGGFTEVDTQVFYGRNKWHVTLSATNLLDEKYYSQAKTNLHYGISVNPPRILRLGATYKF